MGAYKFVVGLAIICFLSVLSSNCKEQSQILGRKKHGNNFAKREDSKKIADQVEDLDNKKSRKKMDHHLKPLKISKDSSRYSSIGKSLNSNKLAHTKSGISVRSTEYKDKSNIKTKKFSLSFSPNSNSDLQQQSNRYEAYSPETPTQQQYSSSPLASSQSVGEENQQINPQQEYSFMNGGQDGIAKYQESNNGDEQNDNKQSVGTIQELMEQRAAMFGQQNDNQEGEQRSYEQQTAPYQGQENDEQQNVSQDETQQYQQEMDRESPSQQMNMQEGAGQDNQEARLQQEGDAAQQGNNQVASFQSGQENADEQANQLQTQLQQGNSHGIETQQVGDAEGGFLMKGGDQEQSYKSNEDQGENYQTGNDGVQQNGIPLHSSMDSGSIANIFSESGNSASSQNTQSLINEGQRITSSDAAQLAEAIASANKGLKGYKGENSLASVASNNANALSFTEGQQSESDVSQNLPGSKEVADIQGDTGYMFHQNPESTEQYDSPSSTQINPVQQEYHHYNNAEAGITQKNEGRISNLDSSIVHQAAKYCTGCPRNARCIDTVCIIDGDEPLAKILGALSGPGKETDDCRGCHHNAKCVKRECICKPGFSGNGTECRADSCLPGCSKHGKCIRGFCVCDHHHYFNGIECAPYKISPTVCPETCVTSCTAACPERCCKASLHPEKSGKPTSKISAKGKKVEAEAASSFYLKPTLHRVDEVFHQHLHDGKAANAGYKPTEPSKLSPQPNSHENPKQMANDTKQQNSPKLLDNKVESKVIEKVTEKCQPECSSAHCSPSCPDHCCDIFKTTQPNLKLNQMGFLKSIAEKFCPTSCQSSCNSACPPICCDRRALSSLLGSSPGSSEVDLSKANDVFRNAMGWFGMMNLLHMMYSMYGKGAPMTSQLFNAKLTPTITAKASVPESCSPVCKKTCLISCPAKCCTSDIKRNKPQPSVLKVVTSNSQTSKSLGKPIPGNTACPAFCTLHCLQSCTPACCLAGSYKTIATNPLINKPKSCKPGCPSACFPQCSEGCCRSIPKPVATPNKLTYGCPTQCPKSCYPSCTRECCSGSLKNKANVLRGSGQYYVNIPCPMECRPYNCLSYCHHECCLRSVKTDQRPKSETLNSSATKKITT